MFKRLFTGTALFAVAFLVGCAGGGGTTVPASTPVQSVAPQQPHAAVICPQSAQIVCCGADCPTPTPRPTPTPPPTSCTQPASNEVACQLVSGNTQFSIQAGQYLKLTNSTGTYLQISSIQGTELGSSTFGEYCASLDTFSNDQASPGNGQVGCAEKDSGSVYPPIVWNDNVEPTALSVPPSHTVYVNPGAVGRDPFQFAVSAQPQSWGVQSWRQPRADQTISCNATQQSTVWNPWQNTTGAPLYLRGAEIYAVSGNSNPAIVQNAALYILDTSGNVRYSYFTNVNQRGTVAVAPQPQIVQPGEYIAAQATNICAPPAVWDWAAFMYVSTG